MCRCLSAGPRPLLAGCERCRHVRCARSPKSSAFRGTFVVHPRSDHAVHTSPAQHAARKPQTSPPSITMSAKRGGDPAADPALPTDPMEDENDSEQPEQVRRELERATKARWPWRLPAGCLARLSHADHLAEPSLCAAPRGSFLPSSRHRRCRRRRVRRRSRRARGVAGGAGPACSPVLCRGTRRRATPTAGMSRQSQA